MDEREELYHYGIKGMKWGVRRTPAQLGHKTSKKKNETRGWSKDAKRAHAIEKKSVKQMSNQELKQLNQRVELESNYKRLHPSKVQKGMKIAAGIAGGMGTVIALYNNGNKIIKIGKKAASKLKR